MGRGADPAGATARQAGGDGLSTAPLREALEEALPQRPFRVTLWDGTELAPTTGGDVPVFSLHSPLALGHLLRAPGQLGLGRAYVSGSLGVDDIDKTLQLLADYHPAPVDAKAKARIAAAAVRAGALTAVPRRPSVELRPQGRRHSIGRDKRAVTHHYDVSNEFFALFLGPSMTYSCAYWRGGAETLEEAQVAKHELVCAKLGLTAGDRVLDVGCGWGAFAVHAAKHHGAEVTGITLSQPQAQRARRHAADEGVADLVEIRVADYRDLGGETYDAIASIGMVEHVGAVNIDAYARTLAGLLGPGGRLLNHGIARLRHGEPEAGPFSERFVFPDAAPLHLSRIQHALEAAGFETLHVEGLREDYARTLREWTRRLEASHAEAVRLAGAERVRVWQVYLRAARRGFDTGFTSVYQVRAVRA